MNVQYFELNKPFVSEEKINACIGYFDGLHLGHQKLIAKVLEISKIDGSIPTLITFEPDPWAIIKHLKHIPHLTPMKQRVSICEKLGIQKIIILRFEEEMRSLSIPDFHELVLHPLHIEHLVCGYDFHYAALGKGDVTSLRSQHEFVVEVIEEVSSEHSKISSTRIEELLKSGNVEKATLFMGRYYDMIGTVVQGSQVGRKYGFPTANLECEEDYVIPCGGVYAGAVKVGNTWYKAILNIGHNPTYNYRKQESIEAHLLDFDQNLYGKEVVFRFCAYLRKEEKFEDAKALAKQLQKDEVQAREIIEKRKGCILCD